MEGNGGKKTMHINLYGQQVEDYETARRETGIQNDNDLVRFLFRRFANEVRMAWAASGVGGEAGLTREREPMVFEE